MMMIGLDGMKQKKRQIANKKEKSQTETFLFDSKWKDLKCCQKDNSQN
jgi:hypothetical protein